MDAAAFSDFGLSELNWTVMEKNKKADKDREKKCTRHAPYGTQSKSGQVLSNFNRACLHDARTFESFEEDSEEKTQRCKAFKDFFQRAKE